jgi:nucleoid-associated protein YejK
VGTKAERQAARKAVSDYHEAQLGELIEHVAMAIDRYRTGEVDAYTVDETIHHYHRAARELWKFCWSGGGTHLEMIAAILDQRTTDGEAINWWERVSPRQPH